MTRGHLAFAAIAWLLTLGWSGATEPTKSGLLPKESVEPWNPKHVAGPDRGTNACPVCTYLEKPVVLVFAKDTSNTTALTSKLEALALEKKKTGLRIVVTILDASPERLAQLAEEVKIAEVALCYLNPKSRAADLKSYRINPAAENTIMIYKDYTVTDTFVDLPAAAFGRIATAVSKQLP
ncbi:MAG: hypothetical protein K8U57_08860 [Planctomycetes bacterium]|nr:hypothetical protein [Planctomycetota bacterium]